jgi:tRNA pseudouridine38-40 synthase
MSDELPPLRGIMLVVAYDRTHYAGWQSQKQGRTLQDAIEKSVSSVANEPTPVLASGRTDRGVHALGQVVAFSTRSELSTTTWQLALHGSLPYDISVLQVKEVAPDFHPRREAYWKRYRYLWQDSGLPEVMARHYCWTTRRPLDLVAMQESLQHVLGKHDFAAFQSSGSKRRCTVRTVFEAKLWRPFADGNADLFASSVTPAMQPFPMMNRPQNLIAMEIVADGFLYNMVRTIAGTLLHVGNGLYPPEQMATILQSLDRQQAGQTAPAQGLYLAEVGYQPWPGQPE